MSDYVPEEVVAQILFRLPAKSVSEFRCVCKSWCALINDPTFISNYTHFAIKNITSNSQVILRHYDRVNSQERFTLHHDGISFSPIKELDLPFENKPDAFNVIGICYGLVCLLDYHQKGLSKSVIVWNPSLESCVRIMFKFTAANFESVHGFGFDPKSVDYKVVRIVVRDHFIIGVRDAPRPVVQVFALKVGSWRNVTTGDTSLCRITVKTPQAYVNGTLHWVGYDTESHHVAQGIQRRLVLLAFDLREEVFKELNVPDELKTDELAYGREQKLFIGALDQKLALMHYYTQWYNSPSYDGCCIWMMKEYGLGESWTKQFKIDLRLGLGKMAGLRRNGEMLLVTRYNEELVSFNTVNRKMQKLGIYGETWSFFLDTYVESLVLMQRINGVLKMPTPPFNATSSSKAHRGETSGV